MFKVKHELEGLHIDAKDVCIEPSMASRYYLCTLYTSDMQLIQAVYKLKKPTE